MKLTVGVGDMKIANNREDVLITHSLGSCLGVVAYDPVAGVGGMLHAMLPLSTINPEKAVSNPFMFVDTGLPRLFDSCYAAGAQKKTLFVKAAGGARIGNSQSGEDFFAIGSRNITIFRKILWKMGLMLKSSEVGGTVPRTMSLYLGTGEVTVRTGEDTHQL